MQENWPSPDDPGTRCWGSAPISLKQERATPRVTSAVPEALCPTSYTGHSLGAQPEQLSHACGDAEGGLCGAHPRPSTVSPPSGSSRGPTNGAGAERELPLPFPSNDNLGCFPSSSCLKNKRENTLSIEWLNERFARGDSAHPGAGLSVCPGPGPSAKQPGPAAGSGGEKGRAVDSPARRPCTPVTWGHASWFPVGSCVRGAGPGGAQWGRGLGRRQKASGKGVDVAAAAPVGAGAPQAETLMRACGAVNSHCPGQTRKAQCLSISVIHLRGQRSAYPLALEESRTEMLCTPYARTAAASLGCRPAPCSHQARGWNPAETPSPCCSRRCPRARSWTQNARNCPKPTPSQTPCKSPH